MNPYIAQLRKGYGPIYAAIDFDGTCVEHAHPAVGKTIVGAVTVLRALHEEGVKLILNTMRSGPELADAELWFESHGLPLFGANVNPTQREWTSSPKVYAHFYIDDAAIGAPLVYPTSGRPYLNWMSVGRMLFGDYPKSL